MNDREQWPESRIAEMRAFFDAGMSLAEIGRRMKLSKNSVNAKIDRLGWPARPSPIKRGRPEAAAEACGARGIDTATAGATVTAADAPGSAMPRASARAIAARRGRGCRDDARGDGVSRVGCDRGQRTKGSQRRRPGRAAVSPRPAEILHGRHHAGFEHLDPAHDDRDAPYSSGVIGLKWTRSPTCRSEGAGE